MFQMDQFQNQTCPFAARIKVSKSNWKVSATELFAAKLKPGQNMLLTLSFAQNENKLQLLWFLRGLDYQE